MAKPQRKRLLLIKGSFEHFGGGERDLINNLSAWSKFFDISVATLHPNQELITKLSEMKIPLFSPVKNWSYSRGVLSEIFALSSKKASRSWYSMLSLTKQGPGLSTLFSNIDAVNITTGMASLEIIPFIPADIPIHTYMHEPNRGLHSNDLHYDIDGNPKQNLWFTNILLSKQRRIDEKLVHLANSRGPISGNSKNTASRIKEVYDIESEYLYPSINLDLWPIEPSKDEDWDSVKKEFNLVKNHYVITIGHAIYAKGLWKTIEKLGNSNLELVQIGGGVTRKHHEHAEKNHVKLKPLPKIDQSTIRVLMRNARALVSNAINEPFGLTPPEAYFVNCPVVVSNQGGFRETVVDGVTGRLLEEQDDWVAAIDQAHKNREQWSLAGRKHVNSIDLSPETQARKVFDLLSEYLE